MHENHEVEGLTVDGRVWRATPASTTGASIWWRLDVGGVPLDRLMWTPGFVTADMVRAGVRELLARYGITVGDRVI